MPIVNNNNKLTFINFYSKNDPLLDELVLIHITKKCDSFFKAKLLEYDYDGIMNFQDATKKKKIVSWNKILSLNKNIVAKIINVDTSIKIVQLSIIYLHDVTLVQSYNLNNNNNSIFNQIQEKLMIYFNENIQLEQFIKSFSIINCSDDYSEKKNDIYNFNNIWINLIYYIDSLRQIENNNNNNNISLWKFFNDNILLLKNWTEKSGFDNDFYENLNNYYYKKKIEINYKIISKIGLISIIGIEKLKKIINEHLNNLKFIYNFKYNTAPYYTLESNSNDSTENDHNDFIKKLENDIKTNYINTIFIKIISIEKK